MVTKINYFQIHKADLKMLLNFFEREIERKPQHSWFPKKQKNRMHSKEIRHLDASNKDILDICLRYLKQYRYQNQEITTRNWFLELHEYNCLSTDPNPLSEFDLHSDDGATTDFNVNTIVFYLEKSENISGGDLLVEINKKQTIIPVLPGMVITFRGDLLHVPTPCSGSGIRKSIVFQIERS